MLLTEAKVICHSKHNGREIITMEIMFPRIILAEFNTHRKFSRNTASSRAIPVSRMIKHVKENMFIPNYWGKNKKGMQAEEEIKGFKRKNAIFFWKLAAKTMLNTAWLLDSLGVHKQITNRLIEPFSYVRMVFTTTDLNNFFVLRDHKDAQPEMQDLAKKIKFAYEKSKPKEIGNGEWHLPYVTEEDRKFYSLEECKMLSVARCASVSYKTVDNKIMTLEDAKKINEKLLTTPLHASPFEHQATPDSINMLIVGETWKNAELHGNFSGFIQYRKTLKNESACKD